MALPFNEQLALFDQNLRDFYLGMQRITLVVGSGISRGCIPMLPRLMARAFASLPREEASNNLLREYWTRFRLHSIIGLDQTATFDLDNFHALEPERQDALCGPLCEVYGEVFERLRRLFGSKERLLEVIGLPSFDRELPNTAHIFLALLMIESQADVLTTNWDQLIEKALAFLSPELQYCIIVDGPTWIQSRAIAGPLLAKYHGCTSFYPENCNHIILTSQELDNAPNEQWRVDVVSSLMNRKAIISGYSNSDYSFRVPLAQITAVRDRYGLEQCAYFVVQPSQLNLYGEGLTRGEDDRYIQLNGQDAFASIYFGWLRQRLVCVLTEAYRWHDGHIFENWPAGEWHTGINAALEMLHSEFGAFLDHLIGGPTIRDYEFAAQIPLIISSLRELFFNGHLGQVRRYCKFVLSPEADVVFLIVLAALLPLFRQRDDEIQLSKISEELTLLTQRTERRQIIFYAGRVPHTAYSRLRMFLRDLEESHAPLSAREILILPCAMYVINENEPEIQAILENSLGDIRILPRFVPPSWIFESHGFQDLQIRLEQELWPH